MSRRPSIPHHSGYGDDVIHVLGPAEPVPQPTRSLLGEIENANRSHYTRTGEAIALLFTEHAGHMIQVSVTSGSFVSGRGVFDHVQVIRSESFQNLQSPVIAFVVGQDELFARYARHEQGIVNAGLLDGRGNHQ